jgi:formylglycine-generating enzyme required for sulfatase activity
VFKETTKFFNDHPPFEIVFDPSLMQIGETDYTKLTANLGMRIALDPSNAGFEALNALLEGLEKTGRRSTWGFSNWPLSDITPKTAGTVLFNNKQNFSCKVDISLLNEKNKTIGKNSITLTTEKIFFSNFLIKPSSVEGTVNFPNIKAEDLTPVLTIVIDAVNGINARNLNANGYMKIETGNLEKRWISSRENMVRIKGGTFMMGSPVNQTYRFDSEGPQHRVTISDFYIGRTEVTQGEWREVLKSNPSIFNGDSLPVENITWFDAIDFCNNLSIKEGLTPSYIISGSGYSRTVTWNRKANGYRLPTEAEWEYACRAGTTTQFYLDVDQDRLAWWLSNSNEKAHPVAQLLPNEWGLYDMYGNVQEWCWDWYGNYTSTTQTDPTGPSGGIERVFRSWAWGTIEGSGSAYRGGFTPMTNHEGLGLRLARNAE